MNKKEKVVQVYAYIEELEDIVDYDEAISLEFLSEHPEIDLTKKGILIGYGWIYNYDVDGNLLQNLYGGKCAFYKWDK